MASAAERNEIVIAKRKEAVEKRNEGESKAKEKVGHINPDRACASIGVVGVSSDPVRPAC